MFSFTSLIATCLIYHTTHGLPDTQIVGGTNATDGQYPYQVSLKHNGNHFCGGVIVSKKIVITAAHCLQEFNNPNDVHVDVGSTLLHSPESSYIAHSLIIHPRYNRKLHINDIGLVHLTTEIIFSKNTKSIDLISYNRDFQGSEFIVTGWGKLWSSGPISQRLQQIIVRGFSQKNCTNMYTNITDNHICTLNVRDQGMCNGDSGGPLTYKGDLVGIVSYGIVPCASGYPDVFTRVYHYREWVNGYINAGNNQQLNIILGLLMIYLCIHSSL